ncbi:MAG: glycosyltransferase [Gemmatimonadaceae bacterium]|nr:glycosyltransferase [Gemmatimonadaceae bacterium]
MRVFLSATSLLSTYGGPAYSVSRLATALGEAGVEVGLWSSDDSVGVNPAIMEADQVRPLRGSAASALRSFGDVDVIHDNGIWLPHNHRLASIASERRVPRVVSTRGMLEPWAMNHKRNKKRIAWALYQRRDLATAQWLHTTGENERATVEEFRLGAPVAVIPNGVELPPRGQTAGRLAAPREFRTALFIGRIYPVKGLPMLIEAWARVRPIGWRLRIAGPDEGGHRAVVERAVLAAGLGSTVSFLDYLGDDARGSHLLGADLFILPSHSESFGLAVAEALAHSLPVLTTRQAPWGVLEDYRCGWWVNATVEGVAGGLRLATSAGTEELAEMGARGRELVAARFRWQEVAKQFIALYERL